MKSKTTVVIPNYNHAHLLAHCLDGVLSQSRPPARIIVVDDCSTDNSLEVLASYPQVEVVRNAVNSGGPDPCINRGLELTTTEFVMNPNVDDELFPNAIEIHEELLAAYPHAPLSSGAQEWKCDTTGLAWTVGGRMPSQPGYVSPEKTVELVKLGRFSINPINSLIRCDKFRALGGRLTKLKCYADVFMQYAMVFNWGMCWTPEVLSRFHIVKGSYFSRVSEKHKLVQLLMDELARPEHEQLRIYFQNSGVLGEIGAEAIKAVKDGDGRYDEYDNPIFRKKANRRRLEVLARKLPIPNSIARRLIKLAKIS